MVDNLVRYSSLYLETGSTTELVDGDDDSLSNDIQLVDGDNALLLQVTEEEYIKMLSALWNGAYIAYPDDYISVVYPLLKAGKMNICEAILECIQNTPAIQQEIAQHSLSSPVSQDTEENQGDLDTEIITTQAGCDDDAIFGMTTQLTDLWNQLSIDILEIITDVPAGFARVGDIIEAIPGVGILPYDDILQFVESILDDIEGAYDAAYTVALRDEIRCALFCIAIENCELTMEQMRDYFEFELGETVNFDSFLEFFESLLLLNLTGQAAVWGLHLLISQVMVFGSSIFANDTAFVSNLINTFFNDPDSDWSTLCTVCAWTSVLDLTTDDYGFIFDLDDSSDPCGEWEDGVGLKATPVWWDSADNIRLSGSWDFDDCIVTSIRLQGSFTKGTVPGWGSAYFCIKEQYEEDDVVVSPSVKTRLFNEYSVGVPTAVNEYKSGFNETADEMYIYVRPALSNSDGAFTATTVTIVGLGTKPAQLP